MNESRPTPLRFEGLRCLKCGYDLAGLLANTCPECGTTFDPAALPGLLRRRGRRRWIVALASLLLVLYAPYSWLLWIDYPWSEYRWLWIKLWPGLPMMLPVSIIGRRWLGFEPDEGCGLLLTIGMSVGLWLGLSWIGARGTRRLILIAAIVLALSMLNSVGLYHAFHM